MAELKLVEQADPGNATHEVSTLGSSVAELKQHLPGPAGMDAAVSTLGSSVAELKLCSTGAEDRREAGAVSTLGSSVAELKPHPNR